MRRPGAITRPPDHGHGVRLSLPRGSRQVSLNGVGLRAIRALQG